MILDKELWEEFKQTCWSKGLYLKEAMEEMIRKFLEKEESDETLRTLCK